jgi:hypothetical protein
MKKVSFILVMLMAFVFTNSQAANTTPKAKANSARVIQKPEQKPAAVAKKKPANSTKPAAAPAAKPTPAAKPEAKPEAKK